MSLRIFRFVNFLILYNRALKEAEGSLGVERLTFKLSDFNNLDEREIE